MKRLTIKRIAINTGGGDAPGLNAVIRAVVVSAVNRGWECYGIRDGYNGLLEPKNILKAGLFLCPNRKYEALHILVEQFSAPPQRQSVTMADERKDGKLHETIAPTNC